MKTVYSHLANSPHVMGTVLVTVPQAVLRELGRADSERGCLSLMSRLGYSLDTLVRLRKPRGGLDVSIDDVPALRLLAASDGLAMPQRQWQTHSAATHSVSH